MKICAFTATIVLLLLCCFPLNAEEIQRSLSKRSSNNEEMTFYIAIPMNFEESDYIIYLSSLSDEPISYTVSNSTNGIIKEGQLSSSQQIVLDDSYIVQSHSYDYRNLGLRVHTSGPATLLVINSQYSSIGEYTAIPYEVLNASSYEYFAVSSRSIHSGIYGQILLVGNEDSTTVTITPTVNITMAEDVQSNSSLDIIPAGESKSFILHEFQTVFMTSEILYDDLTGSKFTSNKPLTVVTGHRCGNIGFPVDSNKWYWLGPCCCQNIMEQIPPTVQWGRQYMLSPYKVRNAQVYKIMASEDSTTVKHKCIINVECEQTLWLETSGSFVTIETKGSIYCYLEADKPILVTQMATSKQADYSPGDPTISVLPPLERFTKATSFFVPKLHDIDEAHLNIVTRKNVTFYIDKSPLSVNWTTITDLNGNTVGFGTHVSSIYVNTSHIITNSEDVDFYGIFYGFADFKGFTLTAPVGTGCADGYGLGDKEKMNCEELDECTAGIHNCNNQDDCVNTIGSFICKCSAGYELDEDYKCIDINECVKHTPSCATNENCINTIGSFFCECSSGYELDEDNECIDINECANNSHSCASNENCINTIGSFFCECSLGYEWAGNDACVDINECRSNADFCEHVCVNTVGSYYCECNEGYEIVDDIHCQNIDECKLNVSICDHECFDTAGSYTCMCQAGYTLAEDGRKCNVEDKLETMVPSPSRISRTSNVPLYGGLATALAIVIVLTVLVITMAVILYKWKHKSVVDKKAKRESITVDRVTVNPAYENNFHFGNGQTSTNSEVNRLYETVDTRMFAFSGRSDERYTQSGNYEDAGEKKEELK